MQGSRELGLDPWQISHQVGHDQKRVTRKLAKGSSLSFKYPIPEGSALPTEEIAPNFASRTSGRS